MEERGPLYPIAVASRLTRMHPQTLRKYERAGLLRPARHHGNQRLYSDEDVARLRRIQYLVEERGLNVAGLGVALAMSDRLDEVPSDASPAEMRSAIDDARELSEPPL
ncbi:MAG TPA: MerR family transcriptional regulator [Candidatus Limnocylindrales bacterium]|jgi:MerR family transcriptional regulator, heat shock protein HspR|nr:MerR family transcriptional regulator [Candidatus Limnocylindrales bacterium]